MSKQIEEWRPIEGLEGLYEVSDWGRVRSVERIVVYKDSRKGVYKCKLLKQSYDKDGYLQVSPSKKGKKKNKQVHRLVAKAFIANPNNYPIVNHKDENPSNNNVDNLEWCTYNYNNNYGTRNERISKQVYQYSIEGELVKIWKSTQECGKNGYVQGNVSKCCNGKRKTHKGYIWKYE